MRLKAAAAPHGPRRSRSALTAVATLLAVVVPGLAYAAPATAAVSGPDAGGYAVTDSTEPDGPGGGPFTDIAVTGTDTGNHFDDGTYPIRFPFAVPFYGQLRTTGLVSSNGNLQFTTNDPEYHEVFPGAYGPAVVAFQADLTTDGPGLGIVTQTFGAAPSRQFVIQWNAAVYQSTTVEKFQIVLTEGSPRIVVQYLDVDRTPGVGVQGATSGLDGLALAYPGPLSDGLAVAFTTSLTSGVALTANRANSVSGQSVGYTAKISRTDGSTAVPTGQVSFFVNGSATPAATVTVTPKGTATYATTALPVGTDIVRAVYSGDAALTSSRNALTTTVSPAATTTTVAPAGGSSVAYGGAVTATVKVVTPGGGVPSGTVDWYDAGTPIASTTTTKGVATLPVGTLLPGSHAVEARFAPSADSFTASGGSASISVTPAGTTTALAVSPKPPVVGRKITLTATVKDGVASAVPTGVVTFYDAGVTLGSVTLGATAKATFVIASLPAGSHAFSASYGGDARFDPSDSPAS